MQSVDLAKVVSGTLAESTRIDPSQRLLAGELMKYLLQFRLDVLWSSEEGVALGDRNRAEFSGPGVYILKQIAMDVPQMIRVKGSVNRVFVKLEGAWEEKSILKLVQRVCMP